MNELIQSEAEKYVKSINIHEPFHKYSMNDFTAGFNLCLELAKMDNEILYTSWCGGMSDATWSVESKDSANLSQFAFFAACKLKDVEIMELKKKIELAQDIVGKCLEKAKD